MTTELQNIIEKSFEERAKINSQTTEIEGIGNVRRAVNYAMNELDAGRLKICDKINGEWQVNQWLKKAILLYFRLNDNKISKQNNLSNDSQFFGDSLTHFDKVPLKFNNWQEKNFLDAGFRAVAGSIVRYSAFISKGVILMPSFVNVGAFVDEKDAHLLLPVFPYLFEFHYSVVAVNSLTIHFLSCLAHNLLWERLFSGCYQS